MAAITQRRRSWRNTIAAVVVLTPVVAFVVYSSFRVSEIECEVCMRFEGGEVCRSASAALRVRAAHLRHDEHDPLSAGRAGESTVPITHRALSVT